MQKCMQQTGAATLRAAGFLLLLLLLLLQRRGIAEAVSASARGLSSTRLSLARPQAAGGARRDGLPEAGIAQVIKAGVAGPAPLGVPLGVPLLGAGRRPRGAAAGPRGQRRRTGGLAGPVDAADLEGHLSSHVPAQWLFVLCAGTPLPQTCCVHPEHATARISTYFELSMFTTGTSRPG